MDIQLGDIVQTRKGHPCGSDRWQVYRLGADIGLRCLGCQRRVLLPRRQYEKSVKKLIERQILTDNESESAINSEGNEAGKQSGQKSND